MDWEALGAALLTLSLAIVLGGVVGFEREVRGQWAGLRTHILVSTGAAVLTLAGIKSQQYAGQLSHVIQGIATGVGFIGAGTIIKLTDKVEVRGLTTASTIWVAAAIGTTVGLQMYALAACTSILTVLVMVGLRLTEHRLHLGKHPEEDPVKRRAKKGGQGD